MVVHSIKSAFISRLFSPVSLIIKNLEITLETSRTSTQLNITLITTGGPATTVTWTRGSDIVTEGNVTVLDDQVSAQYTHTLTVTEMTSYPLLYMYSCSVSNNGPSSVTVYASIYVSNEGMSMYLQPIYGLLL